MATNDRLDSDGLKIFATKIKAAFSPKRHKHSVADITDFKFDVDMGSWSQPIYFSNGAPALCGCTVNKSVPADAVFTDTTYTALKNPNALTISLNGTSQGDYDGSEAKSINVTAASVGAYTKAETDTALGKKANSSHTHVAADITSVNASAITGTIAAANLPSYVDDVLEYNGTANFPATGEVGKIYTDTSTNKIYRWGGSSYVVISDTIALGETSATAYRGDRGKIAYDHAAKSGSAFSSGLYKITTNNQGHVIAATAVGKTDITSLGIPAQDTVYTHPTTSGYKHIPSGGQAGQFLKWSADGTAVWAADNNTWIAFSGATTSAAGTAGYAPAPAAGAANRYLRSDGVWQVPPDTNTTYSAGTGISLSGTTFSNSGVRSIATGSSNGTISVNTNGTSANVAVKGLGSAAYTASTAYAAASHTHSYAGSSSAGGAATSANKLNTNAGSSTQPVYFSNGIPVACTSYANASVKTATTATSATNEYSVISATSQPTDTRCKVWLKVDSSGNLTAVHVKA